MGTRKAWGSPFSDGIPSGPESSSICVAFPPAESSDDVEPFSTQGNLDLMSRAGFVDINTILKYICFEGWLAIK